MKRAELETSVDINHTPALLLNTKFCAGDQSTGWDVPAPMPLIHSEICCK